MPCIRRLKLSPKTVEAFTIEKRAFGYSKREVDLVDVVLLDGTLLRNRIIEKGKYLIIHEEEQIFHQSIKEVNLHWY